MGKIIGILSVVVLTIVLNGCTFKPVKRGDQDPDAQDTQTELGKDGKGDTSYGLGQDGALTLESLDDPNSPLSRRVLYFDLDSSSISAEERETISIHAEFLSAHPEISVILEGHADERGTREYNLALGEKRAKSAAQLFLLQGVAKSQIQTISFGEERPVALDHNESAWRLNRRVEILYSGY
jgi:peptidoglycan-associated lipoprotein